MGTLISFLWFGGTEVTGAKSFFFLKVASLDSCVSLSSPRAETLHLHNSSHLLLALVILPQVGPDATFPRFTTSFFIRSTSLLA